MKSQGSVNSNNTDIESENSRKIKDVRPQLGVVQKGPCHDHRLQNGSLPIAGQEPQAGGADLVVEDHQLQGLRFLVVDSVPSQVENPPLTV